MSETKLSTTCPLCRGQIVREPEGDWCPCLDPKCPQCGRSGYMEQSENGPVFVHNALEGCGARRGSWSVVEKDDDYYADKAAYGD